MEVNELKREILGRFSDKHSLSFTGARSRFENEVRDIRLIISVSKRHERTSDLYWYGYTQSQIDYLNRASEGYFIFGFLDTGRAFVIPRERMNRMAEEMHSTNNQSGKTHHVHVRVHGGRLVIDAVRTASKFEFLEFEI